MSNDTMEPRRGGRSRKQVDRFEPEGAKKGKSKAVDQDEDSDEQESDSELSEEENSAAPAARQANGGSKRKSTGERKGKSAASNVPKKPRKKAAAANGGDAQAEGGPGENFKVDSPFFNAMLSPDIALAPLVEDWVQNYQGTANDETSEKDAVHELVLFLVRACGLSVDVTDDEAMDIDGVVDAVERIQDESVKVAAAAYPLISRGKTLKPFKANLDLFVSLLIKTLAVSDLLYEDSDSTSHTHPLLSILDQWLSVMSSSSLRPIRHTSTYIANKVVTELCNQASEISKEASMKERQLEMEAKKSGTGQAFQKRMQTAENKVKEVQAKKARLEQVMKETFDAMFVHRVRDADPHIRTDCLKELGIWVKKYPELYSGSTYLLYLSKGISDPNAHARLEAVKAWAALLAKESFTNSAQSSIMRVSSRLTEIALRDVDTNVRINALKALALLDKTGVLQDEDDEQRKQVLRVMFDQDPRVRRAAGDYVKGLLRDAIEALEIQWSSARPTKKKRAAAAKISEGEMETYLRWKAFATLLVETYQELDLAHQAEPGTSRSTVSATMARATAAVEALRSHIKGLEDWDGLVDYLLLDHSTADQDMWLLEEEEEDFMLQILIACIREGAAVDDETRDEQTRALIKVYPRLLAKHQADAGRMSGLLTIPSEMNLALYLDMRMPSAYESLWDDITKQFLQHTDVIVLTAAIQAINQLNQNASLANSNTTKLGELTESLFSSLRDAVGGQDVSSMTIDDDEVAKLEAIMLRISLLGKSRDITEVMDDEEGGQSSGWEIVCAFAGRGELPYKDEAKIVEYAIQIVFLHVTWIFKNFTEADKDDAMKVAALEEKRDRAIELFERLALKDNSNAAVSVKRQAFITFVNTYILFSTKTQTVLPAAQACATDMPPHTQHRLGGAFQAAVERYASDKEVTPDEDEEDEAEKADEEITPEKAQAEILFLQLVAVFVGAIRCGVLDSDHAKEPLAHCGRFGATYDAIAKKLVDVLRDEGIYNRESDTVVAISTEALQASYNTLLETDNLEPTAPLVLSKILASAFTIHGNHFTVLKHLHPNDAEKFHTDTISSIFRKIHNFVKQEKASKNKEVKTRYAMKRAQCLSIFKCLILLLGPVVGRGALSIKSVLNESINSAEVQISGNRMWEPLRAYEKRLVLIASKDSNIRAGATRMVQQAEDAEDGAEEGTERSPSPTADRTSTVPAKRAAVPDAQEEAEEEGDVELPVEEDMMGVDDPELEFQFDLGDLDAIASPSAKSKAGSQATAATRPSKKARR